MLTLANLTKTIKKYCKNTNISDVDFFNDFVGVYVGAGPIRNKNNEEIYFDKSQTSLILNAKQDVPRALREGLLWSGIEQRTAANMEEFINESLNKNLLSELTTELNEMVKNDTTLNKEERRRIYSQKNDFARFLMLLLVISISKDNRKTVHSEILLEKGKNTFQVMVGDLFEHRHYGIGNSKNIIVIPVDTTFMVKVTNNLEGQNKTYVSENTLHGQWLYRMERAKNNLDSLRNRIYEAISDIGYIIDDEDNRHYPLGTIAILDEKKVAYFLVAISDFDVNGVAHSSRDNVRGIIHSILKTYDERGQGYHLYMPLLGTGRSRAGLSIQESFDLILETVKENFNLVQGTITVIITPEDIKKLSIKRGEKKKI